MSETDYRILESYVEPSAVSTARARQLLVLAVLQFAIKLTLSILLTLLERPAAAMTASCGADARTRTRERR
jgi:hypothetical protein